MVGNRTGSGIALFLVAALLAATVGASLVLGVMLVRPEVFAFLLPVEQEELDLEEEPEEEMVHLDPYSGVEEIAATVGPAVVGVSTRGTVEHWGGGPQEFSGLGSGVIIDEDGYVLTNEHVVRNAADIQVALSDGEQVPGTLVGSDPFTDLAVLQIEGNNLPVAPLGDSDELTVGQLAVAIGNPLGLELERTVTAGIISALDRSLTDEDNRILEHLIQTDASINPGNSGGPLVNARGQVVGINTAAARGAEGIGFAIPINEASPIVEDLIEHGYVIRPWLGVSASTITPEIARRYNLPFEQGVLVEGIYQDSPAADTPMQPGDIIVALDGEEVASVENMISLLEEAGIGETVEVEWVRGQESRTASVTLAERPRD